jgi:hypothetical protein
MRNFGLACLLALTLVIDGCGNAFVSGSWSGGTQMVRGLVSIVQFTTVANGDVSTPVTAVTFTSNFATSSEPFCGDQRARFPLNNFVEATFMPGQPCSNLFTVVIRVN